MAKNADQDGPKGSGGAKSRAEQLRAAVEGAFGATAQGAALERRVTELESATAKSKPKSKPKRS